MQHMRNKIIPLPRGDSEPFRRGVVVPEGDSEPFRRGVVVPEGATAGIMALVRDRHDRAQGLVPRLAPFTSTIFAEMTALAVAHDAVNLGQGFPDSDGPPAMLAAARAAIANGLNQYPPGRGMPVLRHAVAADRAARYGQRLDPDAEVLITVGATEAVAAAVLALVQPGEEVVLLEPYYDSYPAAVALTGATRRTVSLVPDGSRSAVDLDAVRAAITTSTRLMLVNSPHNPTGTVFTNDELRGLAAIATDHDLLVVTDEVYEHLIFDGGHHQPLATLPGMAERTLSVSSAAKTFTPPGGRQVGCADPLSSSRRSPPPSSSSPSSAPHRSNRPLPTPCEKNKPGCATCARPCRPSATYSRPHWPTPGWRCTPARERTSSAPTREGSGLATRPPCAASCPHASGWPLCR